MHKYEIMAILDPKIDYKKYEAFLKKIFSTGVESVKKLAITELAYKIKNSKTGTYVLAYVKTSGEKVRTFNRKANFDKDIWRFLIINLDRELKKFKEKTSKKVKKSLYSKKYHTTPRGHYQKAEGVDKSKKSSETPRVKNKDVQTDKVSVVPKPATKPKTTTKTVTKKKTTTKPKTTAKKAAKPKTTTKTKTVVKTKTVTKTKTTTKPKAAEKPKTAKKPKTPAKKPIVLRLNLNGAKKKTTTKTAKKQTSKKNS